MKSTWCIDDEFIKELRSRCELALSYQFLYELDAVSFRRFKMPFIPLLSLICVLSEINALPVSVLPVRQYVFLTPDLPEFQLKPAQLKLQPEPSIQSLTKSEPLAGKQYVLVYPSYQYLASRQDNGHPSQGFIETIQNYFINFGSDQSDEPIDAIEPDKPQAATESAPTSPIDDVSLNAKFIKKDEKQKNFYSYFTPASTAPLSSDRRFFLLSEQPQIYGSFSGPSVNPVFNLQPLPVVLQSRSSVAQNPDEPQSVKVASENVQKFTQIPPVMAAVEQPQFQLKKISDQFDTVVRHVAENRVVPLVFDNQAPLIQTEAVVEVTSTVSPAIVEARNSIPIEVANKLVAQVAAQEKSDVLQPQVDGALKDAVALLPVKSVTQQV